MKHTFSFSPLPPSPLKKGGGRGAVPPTARVTVGGVEQVEVGNLLDI